METTSDIARQPFFIYFRFCPICVSGIFVMHSQNFQQSITLLQSIYRPMYKCNFFLILPLESHHEILTFPPGTLCIVKIPRYSFNLLQINELLMHIKLSYLNAFLDFQNHCILRMNRHNQDCSLWPVTHVLIPYICICTHYIVYYYFHTE